MRRKLIIVILIAGCLSLHPSLIKAVEGDVTIQGQLVDRVMAIVGDQIILLSDVRKQMSNLMLVRKIQDDVTPDVLQGLFHEVLYDMVNEQLLLMKAAQDSIKVDLRMVDIEEKDQLNEIKQQYGSQENFNSALEELGLTEQQLRRMVREWKYKKVLTETLMAKLTASINPTSQDMEVWVEAHRDSLPDMPEQFRFSHILIYPRISETRRTSTINELKNIRARILDGEDFGELASQYSDDPGSAKDGGDLGYFRRESMVPEFSEVAFSLDVGEVSDVVESKLPTAKGIQFGFHLIKVEDIRGDEIRARHILKLLKPIEEDEKLIYSELSRIRQVIVSGDSTFADMAKVYSEDENSRDLGGKLQWLSPEQGILPSFITLSKNLEIGEISEPFKSEFGYHLLVMNDHRPAHKLNIKDDNYLVRELVKQEKNMAEIQRVLDKLKREIYIDIRLE